MQPLSTPVTAKARGIEADAGKRSFSFHLSQESEDRARPEISKQAVISTCFADFQHADVCLKHPKTPSKTLLTDEA